VTYVFQGVLTRQDLSGNSLTLDYVHRAIDVHGLRSGIRFLASPIDTREDVIKCISQLQLAEESLYLLYECWGGVLDYIEGFRFFNGNVVDGSSFSSQNDSPESVFLREFRNYGIEIGSSGFFAPFSRGYWGSNEYDYPR